MPYGNMSYTKKFNYNKRFSFSGLPLDSYLSELQFVYSRDKVLTSYDGNAFEVLSDDGEATQIFKVGATDAEILAFVGGGHNGTISAWYNHLTGTRVDVTTTSQRQDIVIDGVIQNYTLRYLLEVPSKTELTISGIACVNRLKNKNCRTFIGFKGEKYITGYTNDYVYPINCIAGLMDFSLSNATCFWYLQDGSTSTSTKPSVTQGTGVYYVFATNMLATNAELKANNTGVKYVGNTKDIPRLVYLNLASCTLITGSLADLQGNITNVLNLNGCALITGSLADLQGKVTNTLILNGCTLITGSLADLQGKITYYLSLTNCNLITGSLSDLQGKITTILVLTNCNLITGVYTPVSNSTTPTTFTLTNTGLSATNLDDTIIACDQVGIVKNGITLTWTGLNRTSASDVAKLDLKTNHAWIFNPDT